MTAPTTIAEVLIVAADRLARLTSERDYLWLQVHTSNTWGFPPTITIHVSTDEIDEDDRRCLVEGLSTVLWLDKPQESPGAYRSRCLIDGICWNVWTPIAEEPATTQAGAA